MRLSPALMLIVVALTACEDSRCCHPKPVPVDKSTTGDVSNTDPIDDTCAHAPVPADKSTVGDDTTSTTSPADDACVVVPVPVDKP